MRGLLIWGGVLLTALALGGCGDRNRTLGENLGYDQGGPDSMVVSKRPPLIVPPDYNLRPPRPGAPGPGQASSPADQARATLIGRDLDLTTGLASESAQPSSAGQSLLLKRTNRVESDLDALAESRTENRVDNALIRRLLAWQSPVAASDTPAPLRIVDRKQTPLQSVASAE